MSPGGWVPGEDSWVWVGDGLQPRVAPPWPPGEPENIGTISLGAIGEAITAAYRSGYRDGMKAAR